MSYRGDDLDLRTPQRAAAARATRRANMAPMDRARAAPCHRRACAVVIDDVSWPAAITPTTSRKPTAPTKSVLSILFTR